MIGIRVGMAVGMRAAGAIGIDANEVSPPVASSMASVTRDATSGIYCPATAGEWSTTLAVAGITTGNPSAWWLMQEAAGNLADSSGNGLALTASGTLLYQQAVTGWSRKAIQTTLGFAGIMQSAAAGLPDIATQSCLLLGYVTVLPPTVATDRTLMQMGVNFSSAASAQLVLGAPNRRMRYALDPNVATGADDPSTAMRPYAIKVDRTGGTGALYTDAEKLAPALTPTPAGKTVLYGGDNNQTDFPDTCQHAYGAAFFLGAAEISDAKMRSLYQTLGWTVLW